MEYDARESHHAVNDRPYWAIGADELLRHLETRPDGLTAEEARQRQENCVSARLKPHQNIRPLLTLLAQFRSPIILILLFAAVVSLFLADRTDALIILTIILVSALLGFWQEHGAAKAVAALLALVHVTAEVWRSGRLIEVNPALDRRNMTANLAVDLVESLFGKSTLMRD